MMGGFLLDGEDAPPAVHHGLIENCGDVLAGVVELLQPRDQKGDRSWGLGNSDAVTHLQKRRPFH
jgi:hypothetical protein